MSAMLFSTGIRVVFSSIPDDCWMTACFFFEIYDGLFRLYQKQVTGEKLGQDAHCFHWKSPASAASPFTTCLSLCAVSLIIDPVDPLPTPHLEDWIKRLAALCTEIWAWIWAREKCQWLSGPLFQKSEGVQSNGARENTFCNCVCFLVSWSVWLVLYWCVGVCSFASGNHVSSVIQFMWLRMWQADT